MIDLVQENATLRNLVKQLGSFLGLGDGGFLPKIGWTLEQFSDFVDKADTDTAFEGFSARRRDHREGSAASHTPSDVPHKRMSIDDAAGTSRKRARVALPSSQPTEAINGVSQPHQALYGFPQDSPTSALWPSATSPSESSATLSGLLDPLRMSGLTPLESRACFNAASSTDANTDIRCKGATSSQLYDGHQSTAVSAASSSHVRPQVSSSVGLEANAEAIKLIK